MFLKRSLDASSIDNLGNIVVRTDVEQDDRLVFWLLVRVNILYSYDEQQVVIDTYDIAK